jgi:hypothetical protein
VTKAVIIQLMKEKNIAFHHNILLIVKKDKIFSFAEVKKDLEEIFEELC